MEFNDDSRFDLTDKLPVIRGTQKATITIEKLISYANKIKEESTMQNNTTKQPLSQEDLEMLNKIANAKDEIKDLKQQIEKNGYYRVMLYKNNIPIKTLVHRLVAIFFIENTENNTRQEYGQMELIQIL